MLCYILILHQTTTLISFFHVAVSCVIFLFYIKPQLALRRLLIGEGCVIFLFYIKPQPVHSGDDDRAGCVIFLFYIKPQPISPFAEAAGVVLYSYSTSNHNTARVVYDMEGLCYILILHQTTTKGIFLRPNIMLCYILILHQTTTFSTARRVWCRLCYILILHQTTTSGGLSVGNALFMR